MSCRSEIDKEILRLEPPLKGVKGANSTGASLVAVNNKIKTQVMMVRRAGVSSYMKQQGFNSPISTKASAAYTIALNSLLAKDSANKISIFRFL